MTDQNTNPTPPDSQPAPAPDAVAPDTQDAIDAAESSAQAAGDAIAGAILADAQEAVQGAGASASSSSPASSTTAGPINLPDFTNGAARQEAMGGLDFLSDVSLNVKIELGRTRMLVEDVLKLSAGAVVELDKLAGDPVDIYVNERRVARGEVLVLNDNFCVRVSEILAVPGDEIPPRR